MIRSTILSLGLAVYALALVGCGGGSSSTPPINQEEQDKKKEEMMKNRKNAAKPGVD